MTRFHKTLVVSVVTLAMVGIGWWLQAGIGTTDTDGFLRALGWLAGMGVVLLSVGIFLRRGSVAVFLDAAGGTALLCGMVLFILYGGMDDPTAVSADVGINLVLCAWTALPLAFCIYTLVLGMGAREDTRTRSRIALWASLVPSICLVILLIAGQMLHFVYNKPVDTDADDRDVAWVVSGENVQ